MRLTVDGVSKVYKGAVWGLRDFGPTLGSGVLGLVGPNGAGKSALMRILATVTKPNEGEVIWDGTDIARQPDGLFVILSPSWKERTMTEDAWLWLRTHDPESYEQLPEKLTEAQGYASKGERTHWLWRSRTAVTTGSRCPSWTYLGPCPSIGRRVRT